jgi:quercetin dioxygenase-like cupin family protein
MTHVIGKDELPHGKISHRFEGYRYGDVNLSFFLVDSPPGRGAGLHKHPYEEVFVVQEGEATFTVGNEVIEARSWSSLPACPTSSSTRAADRSGR